MELGAKATSGMQSASSDAAVPEGVMRGYGLREGDIARQGWKRLISGWQSSNFCRYSLSQLRCQLPQGGSYGGRVRLIPGWCLPSFCRNSLSQLR